MWYRGNRSRVDGQQDLEYHTIDEMEVCCGVADDVRDGYHHHIIYKKVAYLLSAAKNWVPSQLPEARYLTPNLQQCTLLTPRVHSSFDTTEGQ